MADEYPDVVWIRNEEKWRHHNLLETEYELFQQWLRDEGMVSMYGHFVEHLVSLCEAGEYPCLPVCTLHGFQRLGLIEYLVVLTIMYISLYLSSGVLQFC